MCRHYWMIDSQNFGVCKLCHETRDFKPANDKFFGSTKLPQDGFNVIRSLLAVDYPVQGIIRWPTNHYRTVDYCFSVDDCE